MLELVLVSAVTAATPTFEADRPPLAERAALIWDRLEACAGRPAPGTRAVDISTKGVRGWPAGRAGKAFGTLWVNLDLGGGDRVLRHELAHAWASRGEIKEALADVLSDCAASTISDRDPDRGDDLAMIPEPRGWSTDRRGTSVEPDRTSAGYDAGHRLLRSVVGDVPVAALLVDSIPRTWHELGTRLPPANARALAWYLGASSDDRFQALADPDYDGLTCLAEWLAGSDPLSAYSHHSATPDGLPDGANGIDVPRWGAVCMDGPFAIVHDFRFGFPMTPGTDSFEPDGQPRRQHDFDNPFFVAMPAWVGTRSGTMEVVPTGGGGPACTYRPGTSILAWPAPVDDAIVDRFADAVERFDPPRGTAVWLGAPVLGVQKGGIVRVSADDLSRAVREDAVDWLAALVFALAESERPDQVDFDRVEALARRLTSESAPFSWPSADDAAVSRWEAVYATCPDQWRTVLRDGTCDATVAAAPAADRRACAPSAPWLR